jgi:hypothetical protein
MSSKYGDFGPGVSNRGRGDREGFPPIIMGTGKATKTLVEIAALEPVVVSDIPENKAAFLDNFFMERTAVHRLFLIGIVRIYLYMPFPQKRERRTPLLHVALNRDLPVAQELFALTQLIGDLVGIHISETRAQLPSVAPKYPDQAFDYELLFGPRNRSMIIMIVALVGFSDIATISRVIGMSPDGALRALERIERDGIFSRTRFVHLTIYTINREQPWCDSLEAVCLKLSEAYPHLRVLAEQAITLRESSTHYDRKALREYGNEYRFYRRPLWEPKE